MWHLIILMVWVQLSFWKEWGESEGNGVLSMISSALAAYILPGHHILTSHPVKSLFRCGLTVRHLSPPQVTTFCKSVYTVHCHSLWWFPHAMTSPSLTHQISVMLYRDQELFLMEQLKICPFLELSASALKLWWGVCQMSCSSKWQLLLRLPLSYLRRATLLQRGQRNKFTYLKPSSNTRNRTLLEFTKNVPSIMQPLAAFNYHTWSQNNILNVPNWMYQ